VSLKPIAHSGATMPDLPGGRPGFTLPATGCWINLFNPIVGELVGGCGYDYAMIDMEHSPVSLEATLTMIRAVQFSGAKAFVRTPDKQADWIGRLMDMGADGVMVPMVNTVDEAHLLANAAVYAPLGTRGMAAGLARATAYGINTDNYLASYRENFRLMIQIETSDAVERVNELASVSGVDGVFIGPYDLSGSLGHLGEPEHPDTRAAIGKIIDAVKVHGKILGTLTNPERDASQLFDEGYDMVFSGSDIGMLRSAMLADCDNNRKMLDTLAK